MDLGHVVKIQVVRLLKFIQDLAYDPFVPVRPEDSLQDALLFCCVASVEIQRKRGEDKQAARMLIGAILYDTH